MTHLSDLSFVHRGTAIGWFYVWFLGYVFRWDRFEALQFRRIARFELRSIVTLLIVIAIPCQLAYDVGSAKIKYEEGFAMIPSLGNSILAKPQVMWSKSNQDLASALDYVLACGLALETSVFFLMQAFWSYISKSITKSSFMSSMEFRLNIAASTAVVVAFPSVQYLFRNDHAYRESAPQLAFAVALLAIAALGVRTHFRFKSLLKVAVLTMNESSINVAERLEYFKDMNAILTFAFFGAGLSLGIASGDGIASQTIARNKFASDFLVTNLNFFEFLLWVTVVLIFYPRRSIIGNSFAYSSGGATSKSGAISVQRTAQMHNNQVSHHGNGISQHNNTLPSANTRSNNHVGSKQQDTAYELQQTTYKTAASGNGAGSQDNGYYNGFASNAANVATANDGVPRGDSTDSMGHNYYFTDKHPLTKNAQKADIDIVYEQPPTYRSLSPVPTGVSAGGSANPSYGSSTPRIKTAQPRGGPSAWPASPTSPTSPSSPSTATVMVGQQAFVLDEVPGAAYSRAKAAMQYQQPYHQQPSYDQRVGTPTRPRKEPRAAPGL